MAGELRKVTVAGGATIAWREAGGCAPETTPIVFLHGIGASSEAWSEQLAHFSAGRRALAWDAPGYGGSDDPEALAPSAADYADALAALFDALGIGRAVVVGNSLGALMAAAVARRHARRVAALVLSDAAIGHRHLSEEARNEKLMARLDDVAELGAAGMAAKRAPNVVAPGASSAVVNRVRAVMSRIRPKGYAQAARMLALGDIFAELTGWTGPTLVGTGALDTVTPPEGSRRIAAAVPGARYVEIPGAGHLPYVEAPAAFNAAVAAFLAEAGL
jgi:pimeloyl-ACP methyl ester carboxylesterase